ncbi:MAG: hypothetical protein COV67_03105 [Nitrospinae bacterium CG11_big_fil_rev_8_21_14_0_20_56_8]|nr:MAG: hypothetical protein COV67_03105 [Nitrospinae bacterium CG11_big_fil_rev_8_21_14_0_20_56_8]
MAEKKNKGQKTFFRFMALIGVVTVGTIVYGFLTAAPALRPIPAHLGPLSTSTCLKCHVESPSGAPIMPHRPMTDCTFCHKGPELPTPQTGY